MGLFDKFKDLFTDEEEVYETKEIEVEEQEEEHKLPTFMRNKIEKEEKELKILEETKKEEPKEIAVLIENTPKKEENKFPFDFDDDDFIEPTRFSRSVVQKEKTIEKLKEPQTPTIKPYSNKKETEKPKKFRPTPVISPVYGVLDKNYKTEEVVSKDEDSYTIQRASKKVDFESVRKKAYGTLGDDIKANMMCENCELLKEIKVNKKIERLSKEDLLYNMTIDDEDEVAKNPSEKVEVKEEKDITLGEATENYDDFGVTYEIPPQRSRKNEEVKIVNHAEEKVVAEKVEVKEQEEIIKEKPKYEEPKKESLDDKKTKDLELTDDLFNLIDSMYKERND